MTAEARLSSTSSGTVPSFGVSAVRAGILASIFVLGAGVGWIVRLVEIDTEGEGRSLDVMGINRPDNLVDIADLGLRRDETKQLLAGLQQEIVAAQVKSHAARRPTCSRCGGSCRVKDYQN